MKKKSKTCQQVLGQLSLETHGSWPISPKNPHLYMIGENWQLVTDEPVEFEK